MKKFLTLICFLLPLNAFAVQGTCPEEKAKAIHKLSEQLENCVIDYGDSWQTSEMLAAYDRAEDCMRKVVYELFDTYYKKYNKESKEVFENYVKIVGDFSSNLIHDSDWGRHNQQAEVYVLTARAQTHFMVEDLVKKYIKEQLNECDAMYEYGEPDTFFEDEANGEI